MSEVKKGIGKTKIGLIIATGLIAILVVSSVWLFAKVDSLQKQIDSLEVLNNNLQDQMNSLLERAPVFQNMPDATLSQSNPVSGNQYKILEANNTRIIGIAVKIVYSTVPWTKVHIVIDGSNLTATKNDMMNDTWYTVRLSEPYSDPIFSSTSTGTRAFFLEGRSVSIMVEVAGGNGVTNLSARVKYAIIP